MDRGTRRRHGAEIIGSSAVSDRKIAAKRSVPELCRQIPRDSVRPMLPAPMRAALPLLLSISTPRPSWHPRSARAGGTLTMSGGGLSTSDPRIVGATLGRVTGARSAWHGGRPRRRCFIAAPSLPPACQHCASETLSRTSLTRTTGLARATGIDFGCDMSLRWAYIMSLTPDGAAERSGELRIGDQLVAIAGQSVIGLPVSQCMSILAAVEGAEVHRSR